MDLLDTSPDDRPMMNVHFSSGGTKVCNQRAGLPQEEHGTQQNAQGNNVLEMAGLCEPS